MNINETQYIINLTMFSLPTNATKPSLNEIGPTVAELLTFQEIASKPRPLMNFNEIVTKNIRDRLLIMAIYHPSMRIAGPCVIDLEWLRAINSEI